VKLSNVTLGSLYEAEFEAEALRRGFIPHRPTLPVAWDFLVDCPKGVLKVQVKGTSAISSEPSDNSFKVMTSQGTFKKRAIGDEVDVIACWVDPVRVWYIIPTSSKPTKCIRLFAASPRSSSKYEKFRENWSPFYDHSP
jgi:hypothetical protein